MTLIPVASFVPGRAAIEGTARARDGADSRGIITRGMRLDQPSPSRGFLPLA